MSIADIQKMSTEERLQTMEMLWDAISHETKEIDSPYWHKEVLDSRREKINSGDAKFYTLDQLKQRFQR